MAQNGMTEAEQALERRRIASESEGLDEEAKQLLEQNIAARDRMEEEIRELRERNEKRKKEREEEEKRLFVQRAQDDARKKAEEEARRKQKEDEEHAKQRERARKMAEVEKLKSPPKPNFVITKRSDSSEPAADQGDNDEQGDKRAEKKSREQLEAEKAAILQQRIKPLNIAGASAAQLEAKARELHAVLAHLEAEKYDLEKSYRDKQIQMTELAERARQINKVGKSGLKRAEDNVESDKIKEKYTAAPGKVVIFSQYERQKDQRTYGDRRTLFTGPQFGSQPDKIKPKKLVKWNEEGLPVYEESSDQNGHAANGGIEQ